MLRFTANSIDQLEFTVVGLGSAMVMEIAKHNDLPVVGSIPYSARVSELEDGNSYGVRVTTTMSINKVHIIFATVAQGMPYSEASKLLASKEMVMSESDREKLENIMLKKALNNNGG